jgi:hypothetical protein
MAGQISSLFEIVYNTAVGQGTATITNPGRSFRIVSVLATGAAGATVEIYKNVQGPPNLAFGNTIAAGNEVDAALIPDPTALGGGITFFTKTDNIVVAAAAANITQVIFQCISFDGQAVTAPDLV